MKGISYITDSNDHKKAVVIDLKLITDEPELVDDLLDSIAAESRKNEPTLDWEKVKLKLKKKGKL